MKTIEAGPIITKNPIEQQIENTILEIDNKHAPIVGDFIAILNNPDYTLVHLPPFYMPRSPKERLAIDQGVKLGGLELDDGKFLPIDSALVDVIKQQIRDIREKYAGSRNNAVMEQQKLAELKQLEQDVLTALIPQIPAEKKQQINGRPSLQFYTLSKKPTRQSGSQPVAAQTNIGQADMIDLSNLDFEQLVSADSLIGPIDFVDEAENFSQPIISRFGSSGGKKINPNQLQELRFKMQRAMQSGKKEDWDNIVDEYISLIDYLPQFLEHRLAVLDLFSRFKDGSIEMPKTILSVASGPYGEASAHNDFDYLYEAFNLDRPKIINCDFSHGMLKKGEVAYIGKTDKGSADKPYKVQGDMRQLPFKEDSMDMAECFALDNVIKNQKDLNQSIQEIIRTVKIGGLVRLVYHGHLPDGFYDYLENNGLELLTNRHTVFSVPENKIDEIKKQYGDKFLERMKQKLNKKTEYILAVKKSDIKDGIDLPNEVMEDLQETHEELPIKIEKTPEELLMAQTKEAIIKNRSRVGNDIRLSLIKDVSDGLFFQAGETIELNKEKIIELVGLRHLGNPQRINVISKYQELPRYFRISLLLHEFFPGYQDLALDGMLGDDFSSLPGVRELMMKNPRECEKFRIRFNQAKQNW